MKKLFFEVGKGYTKPLPINIEPNEIISWQKNFGTKVFQTKADAEKYLLEINAPKVHYLTEKEQIDQYIWACSIENIEPNIKRFIEELHGKGNNPCIDNKLRETDIEQYLFYCAMENIVPNIGKYLRKRYA